MEINNSNGSGSRKSARFQIFHLLTSPKFYRSLVPDSYVALPPSKLFGTDSSECFFNIHQLFHFADFKLKSYNRASNSQEEWVDPYPAAAVYAGVAHTTAYTYKINVGTVQVKLGTGEIMQPGLRLLFSSAKSPVSPSPHGQPGQWQLALCKNACCFPSWLMCFPAVAEQPRPLLNLISRTAFPIKESCCDKCRPHRPCHCSLGWAQQMPRRQQRAGSERAPGKPPGGIFGLRTHFRFTCI